MRRDYPVVLGSLFLFTLIGLAVKLHVGSAVRGGRSARAVRERGEMTQRRQSTPANVEPAAPRAQAAVAEPARLGALPAQPARHLVAVDHARRCWCVSALAEVLSNDRPLVARYDGALVVPGLPQPARDGLRRRLRHADRLEGPVHRRAVRQARQLEARHAEPALGHLDRLLPEGAQPGAAEREELARHRQPGAGHGRAAALRLSRQHPVRAGAGGGGHRDRHRRRRAAGLLRRPGRPRRCSA